MVVCAFNREDVIVAAFSTKLNCDLKISELWVCKINVCVCALSERNTPFCHTESATQII